MAFPAKKKTPAKRHEHKETLACTLGQRGFIPVFRFSSNCGLKIHLRFLLLIKRTAGYRKRQKLAHLAIGKCSVHVPDSSETAKSYTHVYTPYANLLFMLCNSISTPPFVFSLPQDEDIYINTHTGP